MGGALSDVAACATGGGTSPVLVPPSPPSPARGEGERLTRLGPPYVTLIDVTKYIGVGPIASPRMGVDWVAFNFLLDKP